MRKIPLKNYFILGLIIIISGLIVFYVANMYKNKKEFEKEFPLSELKEIYSNDFENFVVENPDSIVYISDYNNLDFEEELKTKIMENDYINDIVFIDMNKINSNFIKVVKKYSNLIKNDIPNILIIKNGKIINFLYIENDIKPQQIIDFMGIFYND